MIRIEVRLGSDDDVLRDAPRDDVAAFAADEDTASGPAFDRVVAITSSKKTSIALAGEGIVPSATDDILEPCRRARDAGDDAGCKIDLQSRCPGRVVKSVLSSVAVQAADEGDGRSDSEQVSGSAALQRFKSAERICIERAGV